MDVFKLWEDVGVSRGGLLQVLWNKHSNSAQKVLRYNLKKEFRFYVVTLLTCHRPRVSPCLLVSGHMLFVIVFLCSPSSLLPALVELIMGSCPWPTHLGRLTTSHSLTWFTGHYLRQ